MTRMTTMEIGNIAGRYRPNVFIKARRSGSSHRSPDLPQSRKMASGRKALTVKTPPLTTWLMLRSTQALARM
jgi:hypothetical protein